jgi:hypothetical protein
MAFDRSLAGANHGAVIHYKVYIVIHYIKGGYLILVAIDQIPVCLWEQSARRDGANPKDE